MHVGFIGEADSKAEKQPWHESVYKTVMSISVPLFLPKKVLLVKEQN